MGIIHGLRATEPYDAELWASSDTLEMAIKGTRNLTNTAVTIFTDSSAALANIKSAVRPEGLAVRDLIYQKANILRTNGHSVVLRCIPGYSKIEGNERANFAAKSIAHRRGKETDCRSSLAHVKTELKKTQLAELSAWRQLQIQKRGQ